MNEPAKGNAVNSNDNKTRLRWGLATLVVFILGVVAYVSLVTLAPQASPERSNLAPLAEFISLEPVTESLTLPLKGFVEASDRVALVSEVNGRIAEVAEQLTSGGRFKAGDILVKIEDGRFRADLAEARAAVTTAEAELQNARNQVARIRALETRNLGAEARLEDALVNVQRTKSTLERARANLDRVQIRLNDTRIRAPFDGQVLSENASVGQFVSPGQQIASLFATDFAEITVGLSRREANLLARSDDSSTALLYGLAGLPAWVRPSFGDAGQHYNAVVDRIKPAVDSATQTIEAVVRVSEAFARGDGKPPLLLNDLVEVRLELKAEKNWWRIPSTALKQSSRVWRLNDDQTLKPVYVSVVMRNDQTTVIRSDQLTSDDQLLLTDLKAPVTGMKVRPKEEVSP